MIHSRARFYFRCVDCNANTPLWASLSYGTYFCLECSGVHRNLGVHISFVRSLNMDSWSGDQQARMRAGGGNRGFREYMRSCGMPEALQSGGGAFVGRESQAEGAIREKYHTTSAAAYKAWLADRARGGGPPAPPQVPYEPPPPPPNYNAPQPQRNVSAGGSSSSSAARSPACGRQMQGFGSQAYSSSEPEGFDALMASLGSGLGSARSALASAKSAAIRSETPGSVAERARRAAAAARGQLEVAASFDARRDLAHLSAGVAGRGGGCADDSGPQQGTGLGAVAGSMFSAGLGLWGRARAAVDEVLLLVVLP